MPTHGVPHDLAQHGLVRPRLYVEPVRQHGQPEQHQAQDHAEQELGALGSGDPRFFEERDPVCDRLHAGEGAAAGRERLQDEEHAQGLHRVRGDYRPAGLTGAQAERVDQTDGDDGQQPDDEHERGDEEGTGALTEATEIERRHDHEDGEADRDGVRSRRGEGGCELAHAGGNRDRHRQRVVDDERGAGQLADPGPEVVAGHGVRASAVRGRRR